MKPLSTDSLVCVVILLLVFAYANSEGAQTCVQPPLGLVHWWPGDGDTTDIVGGSTGMLDGGTAFVAGLVAQAFGFNGVDGSVATPAILSPVGTIELWVNPTSLDSPSSTQILAGTHGTANGDDRLWIVSSGPDGGPGVAPNTLVVNLGDRFTNDLVIANPLSVGTWTHIAVTFDYSADIYELYVNGTFVAGSTAQRTAPTQVFRIGGATSDFGQNFFVHGLVDEVSVYDRGLTAPEIQAIVGADSAGKCQGQGVGGSVTGISPTKVKCVNQTTKQAVLIEAPATAWDCEAAGLGVSPGDRIKIEVQGIAD